MPTKKKSAKKSASPRKTSAAPAPRGPMTRRDLESHIIAKAWRDPKYKARLTRNPKGVLQEEINEIDPSVKLPAELKVSVHQESPKAYHLVLPVNPKDVSLGDVVGDDLESVAPQTIAVVVSVTNVANVVVGPVSAVNLNVISGPINNFTAVVSAAVNVNTVS